MSATTTASTTASTNAGISSSPSVDSDSSSSYSVFSSAFHQDATNQLNVILQYLPLSHSLHDYDRCNYYLRKLLNLLDQRFPVNDQQRIKLIQHSTTLLCSGEGEIHLQIRCLQVLNILLDIQHPLIELELNWRSLFNLLSSLHFPSSRSFSYPASILKQHSALLVKFIRFARRYFSANAASEIWSTFSPYLSPFDNASIRGFSLLALFLPTHQPQHAAGYLEILPLFQQYENWYDHSPSALIPFFSLYARLAKHQLASYSLLPHLPQLFNTYLQLLELEIAGQSSVNQSSNYTSYSWLNENEGSSAMETLSRCLAKILVYLLHVKKDAALQQRSALSVLSQFLHTISTYYHPSNSGKWSGALAALLGELGVQYAKRRGRELHFNKSTSRPSYYPQQYFLPTEDNSFVSVMLPIALQSLFSKSPQMVGAAEKWLKHVAFFHPSLILPSFIDHAYDALQDTTSPHRMLSIMQSLSNLAPILFHRHYYPQGARHLGDLLEKCLPGIDPTDQMKTTLTLTWFTIVFSHIAIIDGRQSTGKSRIDRGDQPHPKVTEKISARFRQISEAGSVEHEEDDTDADSTELDDDVDLEDEIRSITFRFEDWCLSFLDCIFKLLTSADKYAKDDVRDVHAARLLGKVLQAFFGCLSTPIYLSCVNKILNFVLHNHSENSAKQWGIIIATAASAHPEVIIPKLLPTLYNRIVITPPTSPSSASSPKTARGISSPTLSTLAKSELKWSLFLLSQLAKRSAGAGPHRHLLLGYKDRILTAYHLTITHDDREIRKASGKLLRNFLSSLSNVYPAEWRPFDQRQWSETEQWNHWNHWCAYTPVEEKEEQVIDPDIVWHIPSERELQVVEEIANTELKEPLSWLLNYGEQLDGASSSTTEVVEEKKSTVSKAAGKNDSPLERAFSRVINIVRGTQSILGDVVGDELKEDVNNDEEEGSDADKATRETKQFSGARCPLITIERTRPIRTLSASSVAAALNIPSSSTSSLRSFLLPLLHSLSTRLFFSLSHSSLSQPSLKALSLHIKLISYTLLFYGTSERKLEAEVRIASYSRQWLREHRSGFRIAARPLLVHRASQYHLLRWIASNKSQSFTSDVKSVIGDLQRLAINDFAKVRTKAKSVLIDTIVHYPQSIDFTLSSMVNILKNSSSGNAEQISGALAVLADNTMIALAGRKWFRMTPVVETLSSGLSLHNDDKVELLVQSYFTSLFPTLYPLHTSISPITDTSVTDDLLSEKQVTCRNEAIKRFNHRLLSTYQSLISTLLKNAQNTSGSLHWKYQLMSTAFLFILLRPASLPSVSNGRNDVSYSDVVLFFFNTLHNDLAPMRQISMEACANIFGTHSTAVRESNRRIAGPMPQIPSSSSAANNPIAAHSPSASTTSSGKILDVTVIKTEADWLSTAFYDYLYSGWLEQENPLMTVYKPVPNNDQQYAIYYSTHSPFFSSMSRSLHPVSIPIPAATIQQMSEILAKHFSEIVDNLVHDHPSLAPANEGSQQSSASGAGEIISNLVCTHFAPLTWPHTHILSTSRVFDHCHSSLIRGLTEAIPSIADVDGLVAVEVRRLLAKEQEQDHQCTAAEIIAGVILGSKHLTFLRQEKIQQMLLPIITLALNNSQPDATVHWMSALRAVYTNTDPRRLSWLSRPLIQSAFQSLPDTVVTASSSFLSPSASSISDVASPLLQFKRFRFLLPILIEHGYRSAALGEWILKKFIDDRWLYSSYKQVREMVGWLIYLSAENLYKVTKNPQTLQLQLLPNDSLNKFLSYSVNTLNSAASLLYQSKNTEEKKEVDKKKSEDTTSQSSVRDFSGGSPVDDDDTVMEAAVSYEPSAAEARLFLESILKAMAFSSILGGMIAFSPLYQSYLSHIIRSQHVSNEETAKQGKQAAGFAAWATLKGVVAQQRSAVNGTEAGIQMVIESKFDTEGVIANVCHIVGALLTDSSSSWHIRVSALKYLQIIIPRHSLIMNAAQVAYLEQVILDRLLDVQVEVREQSAATLSSLLGSCLSHPSSSVVGFSSALHVSDHVQKLQKRLVKYANSGYREKDSKKIHGVNFAKRHGGVLGLLAIVSSHPYDLPAHLPPLLVMLSKHVDDPQPIASNIRRTFAEFRRTHNDEWERFKAKFSEEELDAISSVQTAREYFA